MWGYGAAAQVGQAPAILARRNRHLRDSASVLQEIVVKSRMFVNFLLVFCLRLI
jgi:hypothetical protein